MYLGPPYNGYALNGHLGYLAIPETRLLCMKQPNLFVYLYATATNEIPICSNKHETGLLFADDTSLFITVDDPVASAERLNVDLNKILQ